jgi:hypothetical protein
MKTNVPISEQPGSHPAHGPAHVVRIGCGSGFWGDTPEGARQLIAHGGIDYLVMDYLAEITMSILARMRQRQPELGYATDFVSQLIVPHARALAAQRIRLIVNAGGVNPAGCKAAVERALDAQGVQLRVAAVLGDDVLPQLGRLGAQSTREMFSGAPLPPALVSANAYLGAFPIAQALAQGADIVITGRCVDSAVALGPLIHAFGWTPAQHDLLAAGSLVGHVLECGPQATGGFATDWRDIQQGWADIGFPIAECRADGSFVLTKPAGTGGAVTVQTVSEQITYETGDPCAYVLPDVVCDFSRVQVRQEGPDRVAVQGARGRAPTPHYKVSATHADGFRCMATLLVRGIDAPAKAQAVAQAILARTRRLMQREGHADYTETSIERLGTEDAYGPHARPGAQATREVVLKLGVRHADARALEIFAREIFPTSTSTVQGLAGVFGGRPKVQPVVRLHSFLVDKQLLPVTLDMDGVQQPVAVAPGEPLPPGRPDAPDAPNASDAPVPAGPTLRVPLVAIAYARSGDKGDMSSIAVLARRPEFVPLLRAQLTAEAVRAHLAHLVHGRAERFEWPGLHGFNFLLHEALDGGGVASLRYDPQGKAHAQLLLDLPVEIPQAWQACGWVQA